MPDAPSYTRSSSSFVPNKPHGLISSMSSRHKKRRVVGEQRVAVTLPLSGGAGVLGDGDTPSVAVRSNGLLGGRLRRRLSVAHCRRPAESRVLWISQSITRSARVSTDGGIVRWRALAV